MIQEREGDPTTDYDTRETEREILQQTMIQEREGDPTPDYDTREKGRSYNRL
jgi:hypothetical protein